MYMYICMCIYYLNSCIFYKEILVYLDLELPINILNIEDMIVFVQNKNDSKIISYLI